MPVLQECFSQNPGSSTIIILFSNVGSVRLVKADEAVHPREEYAWGLWWVLLSRLGLGNREFVLRQEDNGQTQLANELIAFHFKIFC